MGGAVGQLASAGVCARVAGLPSALPGRHTCLAVACGMRGFQRCAGVQPCDELHHHRGPPSLVYVWGGGVPAHRRTWTVPWPSYSQRRFIDVSSASLRLLRLSPDAATVMGPLLKEPGVAGGKGGCPTHLQ